MFAHRRGDGVRAFFMDHQRRVVDGRESDTVPNLFDHASRVGEREPVVLRAPDERDAGFDLRVHFAKLVDETQVEVQDVVHDARASMAVGEGADDAIDERIGEVVGVGEAPAERFGAPQSDPHSQQQSPEHVRAGHSQDAQVAFHEREFGAGDLGVQEDEVIDEAGVFGGDEAGDAPAGVVRDGSAAADAELFDQVAQGVGLAAHGEVGGVGPLGLAEAGPVERDAAVLAGEAFDERIVRLVVEREPVDHQQWTATAGFTDVDA